MKRARKAAWVVALHTLEAAGLIVLGAVIAGGLLWWRLSQGPISLDFMNDELEEALADALRGDVVSIGDAQASWRAHDRSVGIVLTDVVVAEAGGEILARAPRFSADLSLSALLRADVAFSRIVAEGGEASVVRTESGAISAGLGSPERVAARAVSAPAGAPRGLDFLRDALEQQGSVARDLRELRFEGATLYVRDAVTGVDWRANGATLRVARDASGVRAEAGGTIESGAALRLSARAGPSLRLAQVEIELRSATPSALFPSEGPLAALARVDLPIDATASAAIDEARGLLAADLTVSVAAGRLRVLDREINVERAQAHMSYDPTNDLLTVDQGVIVADLFSARFRGRLEGAESLLFKDRGGAYAVAFALEEITADLRPIFAEPLSAARLNLEGVLHPAERRIDLAAVDVAARGVSASFAGAAALERVSDGRLLPSVRLSGPIEGEADVRDVLDFWPVELADGGRRWVEKAVTAGRAFNVRLDLDLPAEAIVAEQLEDDRLTLSFDFADAEVYFLSTMSPVRNAAGSGVLRGNSFTVDLQSADMAGLTYDSGFVEIPRLNPKGADARFGGVVRGDASDLLAFIDEPPLEFPSSYGVDPSSIAGTGRVSFAITRAMLEDVPPEEIGYEVEGNFEGVSAPTMFEGLRLTDAAVSLTADPSGLEAIGEGRLGPAPAHVEWREAFGDDSDESTRFHVETTLDAATFDVLGAPVRRVFSGAAKVVLDARGRGLDVSRADISADLAAAELSLPDASWSKPAGEPAEARLTLAMGEGGRIDVTDAMLTAPGAEIAGSLALAGDGRLEALDLTRLWVEDLVDAQGQVTRDENGGLLVAASGAYADVRSVVNQLSTGGGDGVGAPITLDVQLDRAMARDGVELTNVTLALDHDGERTRSLDFSAIGEGGPITALVEPPEQEGEPRRFAIVAADAGEALYTFFGVNSVRGGTLTAEGDLPALDAPEGAPTTAVVQASDFVLAGAPPLAQILTIASLEGLANTLAGEGIRFARLDAPLTIVDGRITLTEAQAAGQALGVTVSGDIDLEDRTFDLEGVLVPAYNVNSVLGALPVLGDLLVNRDGEGVFGLTYSIQGPFTETRVFVNPLSALAPGFLRRLFEPVQGAAPADAG